MRVCLVRHGEAAWSLSGQHTGLTDLALTPHGEDEARALAPRLRSLAFTQVLVSPRLRTRQTCELAGCAAASRVEPDLSEWHYGEYEGLRSALAVRRIGPKLGEGQHFALSPASVSLLGIDPHHPDRRIIQLWNELPRCQPEELP